MCTSIPTHPGACVCVSACAQCIHYMWDPFPHQTPSCLSWKCLKFHDSWNVARLGEHPTNKCNGMHAAFKRAQKKIQKVNSYEWCLALTPESITLFWNSPSANNCHPLVEWQPGNEIVWACCRGDNSMALIDHLGELACWEWSSSIVVHVFRGKCGRDGRVVKQSA